MKPFFYFSILPLLIWMVEPGGSVYGAATNESYMVVDFAGGGGTGHTDGLGPAARFSYPLGIAMDASGTLYVADQYNHTLRKVTPSGEVTTLAGLARVPGSIDGAGLEARFDDPRGIAVDNAGHVFVTAPNHTIRKITPAGAVTTFAGKAEAFGSDDGIGSAARFLFPSGVATDLAGNVYVVDASPTVRKITPEGVVTTIAGKAGIRGSNDGFGAAASFNNPTGVTVDRTGTIFISDSENRTIRKITPNGEVTTLAGSAGNSGTADGKGSAARFFYPKGIALDSTGNLFVVDGMSLHHTIRKINPEGEVTTLTGGVLGSRDGALAVARFNEPWGIAVGKSGVLYLTDSANSSIRKITPDGIVSTLAGKTLSYGSADGLGRDAQFWYPYGVAVDSAKIVYVADTYNHTIRKITPEQVVTTLAGLAGSPGAADGIRSNARFFYPRGVAVDSSGVVYVADTYNHTIRKITPAGNVITLAGMAGTLGTADGTGPEARFFGPTGIVVDTSGFIYVTDANNHTVRRITSVGTVTTLAGKPRLAGSSDGTGSAATFSRPWGIAIDNAGVLFVADKENETIRRVTSEGVVTTLAGLAGNSGSADGAASLARFNQPAGVAVDRFGFLYVTEVGNRTMRKIARSGFVTTLAGHGNDEAVGPAARFGSAWGVAVDHTGAVYVTEGFAISKAALAVELNIVRSGDFMTLSWPTNATGYQLQSRLATSAANWSSINDSLVSVDGDRYILTLPFRESALFRLEH